MLNSGIPNILCMCHKNPYACCYVNFAADCQLVRVPQVTKLERSKPKKVRFLYCVMMTIMMITWRAVLTRRCAWGGWVILPSSVLLSAVQCVRKSCFAPNGGWLSGSNWYAKYTSEVSHSMSVVFFLCTVCVRQKYFATCIWRFFVSQPVTYGCQWLGDCVTYLTCSFEDHIL